MVLSGEGSGLYIASSAVVLEKPGRTCRVSEAFTKKFMLVTEKGMAAIG